MSKERAQSAVNKNHGYLGPRLPTESEVPL